MQKGQPLKVAIRIMPTSVKEQNEECKECLRTEFGKKIKINDKSEFVFDYDQIDQMEDETSGIFF